MASLHELRDLPKEGDYFLSFDDLLKVIRDVLLGTNLASKHYIKTSNVPDIITTIRTHFDLKEDLYFELPFDRYLRPSKAPSLRMPSSLNSSSSRLPKEGEIQERQDTGTSRRGSGTSYGRACRRWRRRRMVTISLFYV
jgi:hypothetical protein